VTEQEFEEQLQGIVTDITETDAADQYPAFADVSLDTFEGAGVLTRNRGLVVRLSDGSVFQVTIVQSRRAGRHYECDDCEASFTPAPDFDEDNGCTKCGSPSIFLVEA
jgi:hypothetical protein